MVVSLLIPYFNLIFIIYILLVFSIKRQLVFNVYNRVQSIRKKSGQSHFMAETCLWFSQKVRVDELPGVESNPLHKLPGRQLYH